MSDTCGGHDPYDVVLADLRKKRDEIDAAIRAISAIRGGDSASPADQMRGPGRDEPGAFLGMSIAEAAKKLLSMRRKTLTSTEIAEGLKNGGLAMTAAEPVNVVGSVLARRFDSVGDIVRVARGQWGLLEWYPNRNFRKKDNAKETNSKSPEGTPADQPQQQTMGK